MPKDYHVEVSVDDKGVETAAIVYDKTPKKKEDEVESKESTDEK